jgi:predicted nucleic acid-binding protein
MILIDTDVLIECLRGSSAAKAWLTSIREEALGIPGMVAMELVMGCRNRSELDQATNLIASFHLVWPDSSEFERSYDLLCSLRLSSGLGIPDCLIAAMALSRGVRLYTFNLKHFGVVPGLDAQRPYPRA